MGTPKTDQTGPMLRLIQVFAGSTVILLVLSCHSSYFRAFQTLIGLDTFGRHCTILFHNFSDFSA